MFIKCEKCSRVYNVADEKLQTLSPRFFKCTACGTVFNAPFVQKTPDFLDEEVKETENIENTMPLADIFAPVSEETDSKEDLPVDSANIQQTENVFDLVDKEAVFEPIKSKAFHFPHWFFVALAFVLAFGCVFCFFYVGRFYFVRKMPLAEKVYDQVGISTDITGEGLAFEDTLFELKSILNQEVLSVDSNLVNTTGKTKNIPQIIVLLKDEKGIELQREYVFVEQKEIASGERIAFNVILSDIHPNAAKIEITFKRSLD